MAGGTISTRGIEFAFEERGDPRAPLALVLHGFPDSPVPFLHLCARLAEAGFRAIAPWMRGYAPTGLAPEGDYHVGALAADANALHDALGGDERAVLLGHDWGASAVYPALSEAPQRWRRGVAMAVPPMSALLRTMGTPEQLQRSWYMWLFNTPLGPGALERDGMAMIDHLWATWSPNLDLRDAGEALAGAKEALRTSEHRDAALGYYRSLFASPPQDPAAASCQARLFERPSRPILYLHGTADGCIDHDLLGDLRADLPDGSEVAALGDAGHFLTVERPDEVADLVVDWVTR